MSTAQQNPHVPPTLEQCVQVSPEIELCYRADGPPEAATILLIAGLGQQLNVWPTGFLNALLEEGYRVVCFDNRDVGRSSRSGVRPPTRSQMLTRRLGPEQYTLADMALDTRGLLDVLEVPAAHVIGVSMGGMIGQTLAARFPERVLTLTSIMSSTGGRRVGQTALSTLLQVLGRRPPTTRSAAGDRATTVMRHIGSRGFPFDEAQVRAVALEAWDRGGGVSTAGVARQIGAIFKSGNRTAEVAQIKAPTLVIHGDRDPMVHPSGGRATAEAIPRARLVTIAGMGHDLPAGAWPQLIPAIVRHVQSVPQAAETAA
ncbi:MAG TPA: alpha/beta hydrolase [Solirubrobacteraceae bacterium]|jgi:pimeloyl-ACP methyl ester carboxylesterase